MRRSLFLVPILLLTVAAAPQESLDRTPDVIYVPTPPEVVDLMLEMAKVKMTDVVYDLGCGDGRLVIEAARKYGARGVGIDIDPQRITESQANAKASGVQHKAKFRRGDIFQTDFREATVVTLYLLSSLNVKLRPILFEQLKPGTPVVSHDFDMGDWKPDDQRTIHANGRNHYAYLWYIPADVAGTWDWQSDGRRYQLQLTQTFQEVSGQLTVDGASVPVSETKLKGDRLTFRADGDYSATVSGDSLAGTVNNGGNSMSWNARRTTKSVQ